MLRKLMILALSFTLACGFGLLARNVVGPMGGATHALAAGGNGVGPSSDGATGQARACEAHSANNGQSNAHGLTCTPTGPTFTAAVGPGTSPGTTCTLTFTGTGLLANSQPTFVNPIDGSTDPIVDNNGNIITVAPDGTLNDAGQFGGAHTIPFTAQTATGGTITQTVSYDASSC